MAALRTGAEIQFGRRVSDLPTENGRVAAIGTTDGPVTLEPGDTVVLAVPAPVAQSLLPGLTAPETFESIVNLHYRADAAFGAAGFVGLLNGTAEWAFVKPDVVSVTISAANRLVDRPASDLAATVVAGSIGCARPFATFARLACRKRETCNLRRHSGGKPQASPCPDFDVEPRAGRRLDCYRLARNH